MIISFLKDKFVKDGFIYLLGSLLVGAIGYAFHFLISRQLSVYEYGELQSLIAIYSILAVFGSALSYFVIKHSSVIAKYKDYKSNRYFISFVDKKSKKIALIIFIFLVLLSPIIYAFLNLSSAWGLAFILTAIFGSLMSNIYLGDLLGWEDFFSFNLVSIFNALVKLITGFLIAIIFAKAYLVAISLLITSLFGWFLAKYFANKKILRKEGTDMKNSWMEYFPNTDFKKLVLPTFIFSSLFILIFNFDIILVKNLTNSEMTGYYGVLSLIGKIIFWVNSIVIAVSLPKIYSTSYNSGKTDWKIILKLYWLILSIGLIGILLCFMAPEYIIILLFGLKYNIFSSLLWIFALMALILSLLSLEVNISYARHNFKISYVLAFTLLLMTYGIYFFHSNIKNIIWSVNFAFLLGYFASVIMNNLVKLTPMKNQEEVAVIQTIINE